MIEMNNIQFSPIVSSISTLVNFEIATFAINLRLCDFATLRLCDFDLRPCDFRLRGYSSLLRLSSTLVLCKKASESHSHTSATQYGSIDLTSVRLGVFLIQEDRRHIIFGAHHEGFLLKSAFFKPHTLYTFYCDIFDTSALFTHLHISKT